MNDDLTSEQMLGIDGPLAEHLPGYTPRAEQQALTAAIEQSVKDKSVLVAEAETGTGKTFAYLLPALLSQQKVVISTGTKNLQDQLFHRDLPFLRKILSLPVKIAMLKGRSNYLCKYRIENVPDNKGFISKKNYAEIEKIRTLATRTRFGETSEITEIPEDSPVWPLVTSTIDNCLGQDCPHNKECYLMKARRKAMEADVIVVNHHLFMADLHLKQKDVGELLPQTSIFVLDEAHQLPEIASQFFGTRITSRQLTELLHDTQAEVLQSAKDDKQIMKAIDRVKTALSDMRLAMGEAGVRAPWMEICHKEALQNAKQHMLDEFDFFKQLLEKMAERSKGLDNCYQRCVELDQTFKVLTEQSPHDQVHWYETFSRTFAIHFTPLSVADEFHQHLNDKERSWIFTSATLAVASNFKHYTEQMGLTNAECLQFKSPFNYEKQALLYIPRGLPDPNHANYTQEMVKALTPVLNYSKGRTFILFTSHWALKMAAELIQPLINYPLLIQGEKPKSLLLEEYRRLGNAVLLGTSSFWEGVDVRGEALSCVIIDKLPFTVPDDPIQKARAASIRKQGKNPFFDMQLPKAAIALKQGAGRLIRDVHDYGVLMICDPRIIAKEYGRTFIQCLPAMPRTRELSNVKDFFAALEHDEETTHQEPVCEEE